MQHIDDAGSAHACRIVDARLLDSVVLTKLLGASLREVHHVVLGSEVETAGGAGLDASRLQSLAHPVNAQRALEHLLGRGIELGNIERTSADTIAAANAILLLKINDAIGVLHDRAIGGTRLQASRIGAVHALVFAHEQRDAAVFALVLVELDEVPVIPRRFRHRLVAVVEHRVGERIPVPLETCHFTGFAADARGGVNQFADLIVALHVVAGSGSRVAGNSADC